MVDAMTDEYARRVYALARHVRDGVFDAPVVDRARARLGLTDIAVSHLPADNAALDPRSPPPTVGGDTRPGDRRVLGFRDVSLVDAAPFAMGAEPPPRHVFRGRVISLGAAASLKSGGGVFQNDTCALCAGGLMAALGADAGQRARAAMCTHGAGGAGGGRGGGAEEGRLRGAAVGADRLLPRKDTPTHFWSLGNTELESPADK